MDGGTVITEEVVRPWSCRCTTEQVEHQLPDRDVSRIESGHNGGDYSTDNTIMENSSVNRARGADNMSPEEFDTAVADNAEAVDILERGTILEAQPAEVVADVIPEPSIFEGLAGQALEAVVPAVFAAKAAMYVADECDTVQDKIGWGALSAGGTTLLFVNPVTGPIAWTGAGIYGAVKLAQLGCTVVQKVTA